MKRQLIVSVTFGAVCAALIFTLATCVNVVAADKPPAPTPVIADPPDPMRYKVYLPTI